MGELRKEVQEVKSEAGELREQVSRLFLVAMALAMLGDLRKLASGDFGGYVLSTGLRRELYHLRDIGYIEVKSIQGLPRQGPNLSSM